VPCTSPARRSPGIPYLAQFWLCFAFSPEALPSINPQSRRPAPPSSYFKHQTSHFLPLALFRRIGRVHHDAWGTAALSGDPSRGRLGYMRCPFGSALCRDATFCVSSHRMHRSRRYARDARYCVSTRTDPTCGGIGFVSHDLLTLFPIPHSEFRNPHSRGPPPPVVGFVSHIRHSVETQHFASPSIECAGPADAPETQDIASLQGNGAHWVCFA